MIDLTFSTVRPDPESEPNLEEQRLEMGILPFRVKLNKDLVQFMQVVGWLVGWLVGWVNGTRSSVKVGGWV